MIANMMGGKKRAPEMPVTDSLAEEMAGKYDIAIFTVGRNSERVKTGKLDNDFNLVGCGKGFDKHYLQGISCQREKGYCST